MFSVQCPVFRCDTISMHHAAGLQMSEVLKVTNRSFSGVQIARQSILRIHSFVKNKELQYKVTSRLAFHITFFF
jgi:hypothetical protein